MKNENMIERRIQNALQSLDCKRIGYYKKQYPEFFIDVENRLIAATRECDEIFAEQIRETGDPDLQYLAD